MPKETETTTKLKLDISELKASVQEAGRQIRLANAEFKAASAGVEDWGKNTEVVAAKQKQLDTVLANQEKILDSYRQQLQKIIEEQGENSKAADNMKIKIANQEAAVKKTAAEIQKYDAIMLELQNAENDTGKATEELDKSIDEVRESANDAGDGFTVMKGILADLAATAIVAVVDGLKQIGAAAYEAWQEFDEGADSVIAATGATGETADGLIDVYKNLSKEVVASYADIGTAVGEVNTRFGVTGNVLDDLSQRFIKFAGLNGVDLKTAIDSTQSAMTAFGLGAEDTALALDTLNKAGQDTGESADKIAAALMSNATILQEMGLNFAESTMLLAGFGKTGVDASAALAGLKKALVNTAKDGTPLSEAMTEVQDSIKNAGSDTEALTIAMELFGSKAAPAIAKAIRDGRLSFDELGLSLEDFSGNLEQTYEDTLDFPDKIALLTQGVKTQLADLAGGFLDFFTAIANGESTKEAIDGIVGQIGSITENIKTFIKNFTETIINSTPDILDAVISVGGSILDLIVSTIPQAIPVLYQFLTAIVKELPNIYKKLFDEFPNFFKQFVENFLSFQSEVVTAATELFTAIATALPEIYGLIEENIGEAIKTVITALLDAAPTVLENSITVFESLLDAILEVMPEAAELLLSELETLVEVITSPEVIEKLQKTATEVFDVLVQAIPPLVEGLGNLLIKMAPVILRGATQLLGALVTALGNVGKTMIKNAPKILNSLVKTFEKFKESMKTVGKNLLIGLWNGIAENAEWLKNKVKDFAKSVTDNIKAAFKIKSPSQIMRDEVGKYLALGIAQGIDSNADAVGKAIKALTADATQLDFGFDKLGGRIAVGTQNNGVQNGSTQNTANYVFNQYNNSPKALSRLDIYRQTNNLLTLRKGAFANA